MENQNQDIFTAQEKPAIPPTLNVLTILTFIGCGLFYLSTLWNFYRSSDPEQVERQRQDMESMATPMGDSEFGRKMSEQMAYILEKSIENRYVLLASGLVFTTLCLIGALQMRKLKKSGFYIYLVGEISPLIVTAAIFGFSLVSNVTLVGSAIVALVFVILYATQVKYMVR